MSVAAILGRSLRRARRRTRLVVAALLAAGGLVVGGAAPAQAAALGHADWGFVYLASDASYCYAYAYLPQDMSVLAGTANLYAGVEAYHLTGSTWVKRDWKARGAVPDKIVTDPGWARAKYYQPIKWDGISPSSYGVPVVYQFARYSGTWAFIGRAYWRNSAQQIIGTDDGLNLSIMSSAGTTSPSFTCN